MHYRFLLLFLLSYTLVLSSKNLVQAQTNSAPQNDEPLVADTTVISAKSPVVSVLPTAARSIITSEQITQSGATSLAEILAPQAGLGISSYGASGASSGVNMRGAGANKVLIYVDGVLVNSPAGSGANLSDLGISPDNIETIEIIRGGASSLFGADAIGGVIRITTKKARAAEQKNVNMSVNFTNTSYTPFDYTSGQGFTQSSHSASALSLIDGQELSYTLGLPIGLEIFATATRAANQFSYYENAFLRQRDNAGVLAGGGGLSWNNKLLEGNITISGAANYSELGVPGPLGSLSPTAKQKTQNYRSTVNYTHDHLASNLVADITLAASAIGINYSEVTHVTTDVDWSYRANTDWRFSLGLFGQNIGFGASADYSGMNSPTIKNSAGSGPERYTFAVYLAPVLKFGALSINPSARYNYTTDFFSAPSFSLGALYRLEHGHALSINAFTAYRAPSFNDLYWPSGAGAKGNSSLKPETAYGGDLGYQYTSEFFSSSIGIYTWYIQDVILWQSDESSVWSPSNFGAALYPGAELSASVKTAPYFFTIGYHYLHSVTFTNGLSLHDNKRLPNTPEHNFSVSIGYSAGIFLASIDLNYISVSYTTVANTTSLPSHFIASTHLKVQALPKLAFKLDLENLFNEQYQVQQGYPIPGLQIKLGVNWSM